MNWILLILSVFLIQCAHNNLASDGGRDVASIENSHNTAYPHPHAHNPGCGHETGTENGQTYYKHDGEKHFSHGSHYDIH